MCLYCYLGRFKSKQSLQTFLQLFSLQIVFEIQQNQTICFTEELPKDSTLRGSYGASMSQLQPSVELTITNHRDSLLEKAPLTANASFSYVVQYAGEQQICFTAIEIESSPAIKREIFFDLDAAPLPKQTDDKLGTASQIQRLVQEVDLDQMYGKKRITELLEVGRKVNKSVLWVGLASIVAAWAVVFVQNAWLSMQVKKRL
ncbi:Emp24/gp25L/p24_family/GOLD domain-containing protein [Hexamita inflata]|uniref:Emp24/gp25L/p24 family/GOLD domain-containing protein n=3 Tax=Hexamita inflata TaxID=28002 RepID=A0AA86NK07_9EUKA|nr:Emp24/gp25L/p24 family/GOLD domain-containing protein [Hexamita inflata]